jgi:hypothetical protein
MFILDSLLYPFRPVNLKHCVLFPLLVSLASSLLLCLPFTLYALTNASVIQAFQTQGSSFFNALQALQQHPHEVSFLIQARQQQVLLQSLIHAHGLTCLAILIISLMLGLFPLTYLFGYYWKLIFNWQANGLASEAPDWSGSYPLGMAFTKAKILVLLFSCGVFLPITWGALFPTSPTTHWDYKTVLREIEYRYREAFSSCSTLLCYTLGWLVTLFFGLLLMAGANGLSYWIASPFHGTSGIFLFTVLSTATGLPPVITMLYLLTRLYCEKLPAAKVSVPQFEVVSPQLHINAKNPWA